VIQKANNSSELGAGKKINDLARFSIE